MLSVKSDFLNYALLVGLVELKIVMEVGNVPSALDIEASER